MAPSPPSQPSLPPEGRDMYWEVEAEVCLRGEELWSLFLFDRGATGAEVLENLESHARIRYFFDGLDESAVAEWPARFCEAYPGVPAPRALRAVRKPREDWGSTWRRHFAPLPLGQGLVVRPPWPTGPDDPGWGGRRSLVIDPGQGFGTGRHPSTALALELLEERCAGQPLPGRMMDVGTGSGILALAAALFGLTDIWAIDIDGRAMPEVRRNFSLNGQVTPRLIQGGPGCLRGEFSLVTANLVTPLLLAEREALAAIVAPGGSLILSGILDDEVAAVVEGYRSLGCRRAAARGRDGWSALSLTKI